MKFKWLIVFLLLPTILWAAPVTVGIVSPDNRPEAAAAFEKQIRTLMAGQADVGVEVYPFSLSVEKNAADQAIRQANASTDVVMVVGEVASGRAAALGITKPVVALFPPADLKAAFQFSLVWDINYKDEFKTFHSLLNYQHLHVLYSLQEQCSSTACKKDLQRKLDQIGVPYTLIGIGEPNVAHLSKLLTKSDTVVIFNQPQLDRSAHQKLIDMLNRIGVQTFSFGMLADAEDGVLAVNSPEDDLTQVARLAALGVMELIENPKMGHKTVKVRRVSGLVINMETAQKVGFSPSWKHMRVAELIHADTVTGAAPKVSFKRALEMSLANSDELSENRAELERTKQMVNKAGAALFPTVTVSLNGRKIDDDRAAAYSGMMPENAIDSRINFQQVVYSEKAFSAKSQAKFGTKAQKHVNNRMKLDILESASKAYLNVLRAQTFRSIALDNLETTKRNLELARTRDMVGAANPAEVYNWESRLAMGRKDVADAENSIKLATTELARLMGKPIDGMYILESVELGKGKNLANLILKYEQFVNNPASFQNFKKFMMKMALDSSEELKALDQIAAMNKRAVASAKRSYYHPTVAVSGEYRRYHSKYGEGSNEIPGVDDDEWNVGFSVSLPLFEGGSRLSDVRIERQNLRKTYHQKARVTKLVQQRMIVALENARTAYGNIELAKVSANAATKTLEIVTDLYSKGAVSITELIDAQNAKLTGDLYLAGAEYDFMNRSMEVERAYGQFFVFNTAAEDSEFQKRLTGWFQDKGVNE